MRAVRISRRRGWRAAAVLAAGAALAFAAGPLAAAPATVTGAAVATQTTAEPAALALAHDHGLSLAAAAVRVARQGDQAALAGMLEAKYPHTYAGSWVDQDHGGLLVSRFTHAPADFTALAATFHLTGNAVLGEPARYSLAALERAQAKVLIHRAHLEAVSTSLDLVHDRVLFHSKKLASSSLRAAAQTLNTADPSLIQFDSNYHAAVPLSACAENALLEPGCTQPIRSGQLIKDQTPGLPAGACTLGYNVTSRSDGKRYVLTDGHCVVDDGDPLNDTAPWGARNNINQTGRFGVVHSAQYSSPSGPADWALIHVDNSILTEPDIYVQASTDNNPARNTTRNENYAITGIGGTVVNQYYCKMGSSGGTGCGQVLETGVGNQVDPTHYITNMAFVAQTAIYGPGGYRLACQGDSGGPVFSGHLGYGLVESGALGSEAGHAPNGALCYFDYYYTGLTAALNTMNVNLTLG
jgi:Trypsin